MPKETIAFIECHKREHPEISFSTYVDHLIPFWSSDGCNEFVLGMMMFKVIADQAYVVGNILGFLKNSMVHSL